MNCCLTTGSGSLLPKPEFSQLFLAVYHAVDETLTNIIWSPDPGVESAVVGRGDKLPRPPLGTRLRVGLVWAGSSTHPDDHNRSVGLESLLPLASIPGVRIYSLQHGPRGADAVKMAHPALIKDFSKHLKDFADTAAVVNQLDLVITVDSAVAHLAGALGKPVWVMIPAIPDFRWQTNRSDSPWYPTMRLFRQAMDGDWERTIASMTDQLRELAAKAPFCEPEPATVTANSIFTKPDGKPRFTMTAPRQFLDDPGVGFLMRWERSGVGYEYATRALLDTFACTCTPAASGTEYVFVNTFAHPNPFTVGKLTCAKSNPSTSGNR